MVRRPINEYQLENDSNKIFVELDNGAKLRVLLLEAENKNDATMNIIFYSGFISYIFLWRESVKILKQSHNIYFIETREKEFSSFPPNEIIYDVESLGEDFIQTFKSLGLKKEESVIAGSSIASVGILEAMSKYDFRPFFSIHSSPQTYYETNNKPKILATYFPLWFIIIIKPIIYLIYKIKFRKDTESGRSRIHTLSRMFSKPTLGWMKKIQKFMPEYEMKKEAVEGIKSPVVIVGAQDDPEHDTDSIKKIINYIPGSKYVPVPYKNDTHNEIQAGIILDEINNLKKKKN